MSLESVGTLIKARAIAASFKQVTGVNPELMQYNDGSVELVFNDEQQKQIREYLDNQVRKKFTHSDDQPPKIIIKWGDILIPWSLKFAVPSLLGAFGLGYAAKGGK